jgi:DNA-binding protein YbaB
MIVSFDIDPDILNQDFNSIRDMCIWALKNKVEKCTVLIKKPLPYLLDEDINEIRYFYSIEKLLK